MVVDTRVRAPSGALEWQLCKVASETLREDSEKLGCCSTIGTVLVCDWLTEGGSQINATKLQML